MILEINDDYFEITEKIEQDSAAAYSVKVRRCLTNRVPEFVFGEDKFFVFSISAINSAKEISEEEFQLLIKQKTVMAWSCIIFKELQNPNDAFMLSKKEMHSREAYQLTFGNFKEDIYHKLKEELMTALGKV